MLHLRIGHVALSIWRRKRGPAQCISLGTCHSIFKIRAIGVEGKFFRNYDTPEVRRFEYWGLVVFRLEYSPGGRALRSECIFHATLPRHNRFPPILYHWLQPLSPDKILKYLELRLTILEYGRRP